LPAFFSFFAWSSGVSSSLTDALISARMSGVLLDAVDYPPVTSMEEACAIQAAIALACGPAIAGWKVGFGPQRQPFAAPVLARTTFASGAAIVLPDQQSAAQPLLVELELGLVLARDLPAGALTREALLDSVAYVFAGIELVRSRFYRPEQVDFLARVADHYLNHAYVMAQGVSPASMPDLRALHVRLMVDGQMVEEGRGTHPEGDPLAPVLAVLAAGACLCGPLRAGQFITTGTLTTPLPLKGPAMIEGVIESVGRVNLRTTMPEIGERL
jgi:2-keto-4-pentenoate hydratase